MDTHVEICVETHVEICVETHVEICVETHVETHVNYSYRNTSLISLTSNDTMCCAWYCEFK